MDSARLVSDWTVRSSTPAPDVSLKALVIYPTEYKPVQAQPNEPGIRIARRGVFVVAAEHVPGWQPLATAAERGAELVLRERSGRNHAVRLGWNYVPAEHGERYGADGLAQLMTPGQDDLVIPWRAADLQTLA